MKNHFNLKPSKYAQSHAFHIIMLMKEFIVNIEQGWETYKVICATGSNPIKNNDDWKWIRSNFAKSEDSLKLENQLDIDLLGAAKKN